MRTEIWGEVHVICTAVPMHFNTTFISVAHRWAFCRKFLVSFESPCRLSSKSSIGSEYTNGFTCPHSQRKIQRIEVRRPWGSVDWASASYPLPTEILVYVLSDSAEEMRWFPIGSQPHVLLLMKRHMFRENWQSIHQRAMVHWHLLVFWAIQLTLKCCSRNMLMQHWLGHVSARIHFWACAVDWDFFLCILL
jgi:hypothetical protein